MKDKPTAAEIQAAFEEQERQEVMRQQDLIRVCMEAIFKGYQPATAETADNFFTTAQLCTSINEHIGEAVRRDLLFEYLVGEGYKFARAGNSSELRWMVKSY